MRAPCRCSPARRTARTGAPRSGRGAGTRRCRDGGAPRPNRDVDAGDVGTGRAAAGSRARAPEAAARGTALSGARPREPSRSCPPGAPRAPAPRERRGGGKHLAADRPQLGGGFQALRGQRGGERGPSPSATTRPAAARCSRVRRAGAAGAGAVVASKGPTAATKAEIIGAMEGNRSAGSSANARANHVSSSGGAPGHSVDSGGRAPSRMEGEHIGDGAAGEGLLAGERHVRDHREGPHVELRVRVPVARVLRAEVARRAQHHALRGLARKSAARSCADPLGDPEVGDLGARGAVAPSRSRMFDGLMSRCTIPRPCATESASPVLSRSISR